MQLPGTLQLDYGAGKWANRSTVAVMSGVTNHSTQHLNILNNNASRAFPVNTGAQVSISPAGLTDRKSPKTASLSSANGSPVHTYGTHTLTLRLGENFVWLFVVTDIHATILGADFLLTHAFMVNMTDHALVDQHIMGSPWSSDCA